MYVSFRAAVEIGNRNTALRTGGVLLRNVGRCLLILVGCLTAPLAFSDEPEYEINIPALPADLAIRQLAEQTEHATLFRSKEITATRVNAIAGRYRVEDALHILFADTDLSYGLTKRGVITVARTFNHNRTKGEKVMSSNQNYPAPQSLFGRIGAVVAAVVLSGGVALAEEIDTEISKEESKYIEEIIVTGERGDRNELKTPMTVTGFNEALIDQLGINNPNDLEALVPGLQMGHTGTGMGKAEDDHIYMRGIGNQRSQAWFSDVALATSVDGVVTENTYALSPGNMFDVERIEVARGPQGTTGGKAGLAGAINFFTKKPTETWDFRWMSEFNDQFSQRHNVAFGGPIGDSNFMYRITAVSWTGDGDQKNVGSGPDYDKPDHWSFAPQLRYKNGPWDANFRYSYVQDTGVPRTSIELAHRDIETRCLFEGVDGAGNPRCWENPFYGAEQQAPSVQNCDPASVVFKIICEGGDLLNEVDRNLPSWVDNFVETAVLKVKYDLNDNLALDYHLSYRESREWYQNDTDGTSRVGGGTYCDEDSHANTTQGVDPRFCAADGAQNGFFIDRGNHRIHQTEMLVNELKLISSYDGPFNYVVGIYMNDGDTGRGGTGIDLDELIWNTDNNDICRRALPESGRPLYSPENRTNQQYADGGSYSCPGDYPNVGFTDWVYMTQGEGNLMGFRGATSSGPPMILLRCISTANTGSTTTGISSPDCVMTRTTRAAC